MESLKKTIRREMWYVLFLVPGVLLFAFAVIVPFVTGIRYSFTNWDGISRKLTYIGWDNYVNAIQDPDLWTVLGNTFKYAIILTLLVNLVALLFALLLDSYLPLRNLFRTIFFLPSVISVILAGFIWSYNYSQGFPRLLAHLGMDVTSPLGNPDRALYGLIIIAVWQGIGSPMIIYIAGLQGIPAELSESARIDGAGPLRVFRNVTLPLLAPSVTINMLLVLTGSLKVFDLVLVTTNGGPGFATEVIATFIYKNAFSSFKAGYGMALSMIFFVILVIVTVVQVTIFRKREVEM
ncbi:MULTISPECIES: sugar ABC transporter permease [unclassified Paenibacillus]|uniref:carbohydrate ABC transporter permease n=1 Tax=unclassified Paenibacillus TaxID=185978 RepID=UPI0010525E26|nr:MULTISPECIES: sugar ABC transporter permease [unclassified Paenibacillus]NIK69022.1 multiple sugar transport system permease protein/raffinose/stachyose/melibiose transport system permease protein [Paenibacillus sp. BK720]TCM86651.1 carbohydrate ABC transporter membrane protein 1 (CUT1 family) [Paenibacillus sp. BK033]